MLTEVKKKCNDLVDNYNKVNFGSLENIRDSVREIKVSCIKALDDLKEKINIKDIVNNPQIFKEFDIAYKKLGKIQNEKFSKKLENFKKLNIQVSILVSNLVEKIYNLILGTLQQALNDQQYMDVNTQIIEKMAMPVDQSSLISNIFEFNDKKSRNTYAIPKNNIQGLI